jgi:hypothetical protein
MSVYPSNNAPQAEQFRCPYLGHYRDPSTWSNFACPDNFCHKAAPERPILESYQERACLTADHQMCPVYLARSRWRQPLPPSIGAPEPLIRDRRVPLILGGMAAVLVLGIASMVFALVLLGSRGSADESSGSQGRGFTFVQSTAALTQEREFLPTFTPRPTRTPVPTYAPIVTELLFENNLRTGPGTDYDSAGLLPSGVLITLRGRNQVGDWLLVESADGVLGWILATQIDSSVDTGPVPYIAAAGTDQTPDGSTSGGSLPATAVVTQETEPETLSLNDFALVLSAELRTDPCDNHYSFDDIWFFEFQDSQVKVSYTTGFADLQGDYDANSGMFDTFGQFPRSARTFTGQISIDRDLLIIDAKLSSESTNGCNASWDLTGRTRDW